MRKTYNISYDLIIENEKRVLRYAARTSDCFSFITEQIKPFSARPAKSRHDAVLEPISDCLVKQTVGVKSRPGSGPPRRLTENCRKAVGAALCGRPSSPKGKYTPVVTVGSG